MLWQRITVHTQKQQPLCFLQVQVCHSVCVDHVLVLLQLSILEERKKTTVIRCSAQLINHCNQHCYVINVINKKPYIHINFSLQSVECLHARQGRARGVSVASFTILRPRVTITHNGHWRGWGQTGSYATGPQTIPGTKTSSAARFSFPAWWS